MILATIVLLSAQSAPTVAAIERLSPEAAGDVALAGKEHNHITEVVIRKVTGPEPPGFVELEMVERAIPAVGGCVRRRWTVNFYGPVTAATNDARLSDAHAGTEVALRRAAGCPLNRYVSLNGGLESPQALAALAHLEKIWLGRVKAVFSCLDSTATNLCASPRTLMRSLAKITPWAVMRNAEITTFWLGDPGQVATQVSYSASRPMDITVTRNIAAPF